MSNVVGDSNDGSYLNPISAGRFWHASVPGGGWFSPQVKDGLWRPLRPLQRPKTGKILFLTSSSICRVFEMYSMLHNLAVRVRRSSVLLSWKFARRKSECCHFSICMHNMHTKWKLRTFWIWIWHQKIWFVTKLCIWSIFWFFVYDKFRTGQLWRAPVAKRCNFSTKKFHQQVPLDAKRKVIRCQIFTTTHTATGSYQRWRGLIQPPPGTDRVNIVQ